MYARESRRSRFGEVVPAYGTSERRLNTHVLTGVFELETESMLLA